MGNPPTLRKKIILQSLAAYTSAKKCNLIVRKQPVSALLLRVSLNKRHIWTPTFLPSPHFVMYREKDRLQPYIRIYEVIIPQSLMEYANQIPITKPIL